MHASEAEILVGIRKVQAELSPALPPELAMKTRDVAAVRIRLQVLRATALTGDTAALREALAQQRRLRIQP